MKTILLNRFGGAELLQIEEKPIPQIKPDEILVHNSVVSINPYDCMARSGAMWFMEGFKFPKILGCESGGVIEQVGNKVINYRSGDRVIVFLGRRGAYAEYVAVKEKNLGLLPAEVSLEQGAALPVAGTTAYDALHELGEIKMGDKVLINGASGSVGTFAVQLAKLEGAHVTAVCSADNLTLTKGLGADEVLDYKAANFKIQLGSYNIIFDTPSVLSFREMKQHLVPGGTFISTLPTPGGMLQQLTSNLSKKKYRITFGAPNPEKIARLANMVDDKKLKVVFDHEFPIEQIAEAHRLSESKRARGKILARF